MQELLEQYGALLQEVDAWFDRCHQAHGDEIRCHRGCSACCRGLFDITVLDALYLRSGFDHLSESLRQKLGHLALQRLQAASALLPAFRAPWGLNHIPEEQWDVIMPEEDETPCLLLSDEGTCLLYDYRPMTCRLNGIPLIDSSGEEFFDEWCTLNFTGHDPRLMADLRFPFDDLFRLELYLFQKLMQRITGRSFNELDTIIPAALLLNEESVRAMERIASACHA